MKTTDEPTRDPVSHETLGGWTAPIRLPRIRAPASDDVDDGRRCRNRYALWAARRKTRAREPHVPGPSRGQATGVASRPRLPGMSVCRARGVTDVRENLTSQTYRG